MNIKDIIKTSFNNLRRRKGRTILTIIGVVIGICAVVVMISIGFGMNYSAEKQMRQYGEVTSIEVYGSERSGPIGKGPFGSNKSDDKTVKLDDALVDTIKAMPHVESVLATLTLEGNLNGFYPELTAGIGDRYAGWSNIMAMDYDSMLKSGYKMTEDSQKRTRPFDVYIGPNLEYEFRDTLRSDYDAYVDRYKNGFDEKTGKPLDPPPPFFDAFKTPLKITLQGENSEGKAPEYKLNPVGRIDLSGKTGAFRFENAIILSLEDMRQLIRNHRPSGDRNKPILYSSLNVKVDHVNHVEEVENTLKGMSLNTSSMIQWRKQMQEHMASIQLLLGGLGAISLLVAAVGITNTMVMSITERYKEIGIMKALGCYLKDIRLLFLSEAMWIGIVGGIVGALLSVIISFIINCTANRSFSFETIMKIATLSDEVNITSLIPLWLIAFAIIFCGLIGIISGYLPANNAVKIEALEAIRNE